MSSLHAARISIENNGWLQPKSYKFCLNDSVVLTAQCNSVLHTGSFRVRRKQGKDSLMAPWDSRGADNSDTPASTSRSSSSWSHTGEMSSPGLFFEKSIIRDDKKHVQGIVLYNNTSRTGDLMDLKVLIPRIHTHEQKLLVHKISTHTALPRDCAQLVAEFCDLRYAECIDLQSAICQRIDDFYDDKTMERVPTLTQKVMTLRNKLPSWNANINAYTLEFGGRALVPSVHNFQLVCEDKAIALQLGKVSDTEFNVDFKYPLSPYQAFTICLSVIDRTFVWD